MGFLADAGMGVEATLSVNGVPQVAQAAFIPDPADVVGRYNAKIQCTGSSIEGIIAAAKANAHTFDPVPDQPGRYVWRHPVYLIGDPVNATLDEARRALHSMFPYISPDAPD